MINYYAYFIRYYYHTILYVYHYSRLLTIVCNNKITKHFLHAFNKQKAQAIYSLKH